MSSFNVPGTIVNAGVQISALDEELHMTPAMAKFASLEKFRASSKFKVGDVTTVAVSPFGPLGKAKAGFGYMHADVTYDKVTGPNGAPVKVPGLALVRGDAVAMLPFLNCDGVDNVVLTQQARLPIDEPDYKEIPAGMSDAAVGKSGYAAAIAKEMEEEVGLNLDRSTDFVKMGTFIPSAGGSDERIVDYWTRVKCSKAVLTYLQGRLGGALAENEQITARLVPLATVRKQILSGELTDAKLITALWFYDNMPKLKWWSCKKQLALVDGKPTMVEPVSLWSTVCSCFTSRKTTVLTSAAPSNV